MHLKKFMEWILTNNSSMSDSCRVLSLNIKKTYFNLQSVLFFPVS